MIVISQETLHWVEIIETIGRVATGILGVMLLGYAFYVLVQLGALRRLGEWVKVQTIEDGPVPMATFDEDGNCVHARFTTWSPYIRAWVDDDEEGFEQLRQQRRCVDCGLMDDRKVSSGNKIVFDDGTLLELLKERISLDELYKRGKCAGGNGTREHAREGEDVSETVDPSVAMGQG